MNDVRADVDAILKNNSSTPAEPIVPPSTPKPTAIKVGDLVSIAKGATYYTGKTIPNWVIAKNWYVKSIKKDRVVVDKSEDGKSSIYSAIKLKYLTKVNTNNPEPPKVPDPEPTFKPYLVEVIANALNVRSGPGTNYAVKTVVHKGDVYTIVDEDNGWGKLKSGAGWISLQYTKKR